MSFSASTPPLPPPKHAVSSPTSSRVHTPNTSISGPPPPPPPRPDSQSFGGPHSGPPNPYPYSESDRQPSTHEAYHAQAQPHPQVNEESTYTLPIQPPPEGWLPQYATNLSKPDLEHLLSDPSLLSALVHHPTHTHPSILESNNLLQHHIDQNTALAAHLSKQQEALQHQQQAVSTHFLQVKGLEQQWKRTQERMEAALAPFGPRELYSRLGAVIGEGEAECRAIEESFLDGDGVASEREVVEWVKKVREGRAKVAIRRERRARWDEGRVGGWR